MENSEFYRGHGSYSAKCVLKSGVVIPPTLSNPPLTGELYATARLNTIDDGLVYFTKNQAFACLYSLKEAGVDKSKVEALLIQLFPGNTVEIENLRRFFAERTFHAPLNHGDISKKIRSIRAQIRRLDTSVDGKEGLKNHTLQQKLTILEGIPDKLDRLSATQLAEIKDQYPVLMCFRGIVPRLQPLPPYIIDPSLRSDLEWSHDEPVPVDKVTDIYVPREKVDDINQVLVETRRSFIRVHTMMLDFK